MGSFARRPVPTGPPSSASRRALATFAVLIAALSWLSVQMAV